MERNSQYSCCKEHHNQYLMYVQTTFQGQSSSNYEVNKISKCHYCLISSEQNIQNFTQYNQFSERIIKKYQQIEGIKSLLQVVYNQIETLKKENKYRKLYEIQNQIILKINKILIPSFEQCRTEFINMNPSNIKHSQQFLELFNLKITIEFEEFYYYELLEQSIALLSNFPLLIRYKSTTKPFSISKKNDMKIKKVSYKKDNDMINQSIKSNLMKFQEKIFIFGDNVGYLYYYNYKTDAKIQKRYHTRQICVIEKLTEYTFCSGAQDSQVITYRIEPNDKLVVISKIKMREQVFRLRRIDNNRIAVNQGQTVCILNVSKKQSFIEKSLSFPGFNNDIFGILYLNQQIITLHRDGRLNYWNWKKGYIVRSQSLSKFSHIQLTDFQMQPIANEVNQHLQNENYNDMQIEDNNDDTNYEELDIENFEPGDLPAMNEEDEDEWNTDSSDSFDLDQHIYSRVRLLGKNFIAAVTYSHRIKIIDYNDFYMKNPPSKIDLDYDLLCLESIPNTDLVLIAGQSLDIYNLKKQKMEITIENEEEEEGQENKSQFGQDGLIGGAIFNQSQIVTIKQEELELIFIQL